MKKEKMKKAEEKEVAELKAEGDSIEGDFISIEESKLYNNSWAVTFKDADTLKVAFVNKVGHDLIMQYLKEGDHFILSHKGMKETADGRNKYHTYELYYK